MSYTITSPPSVEPVSVSEFKIHARVDGTAEDSVLPIYIAAARHECEQRIGKSLITQTIAYTADEWPCDGTIKLSHGPVLTLTGITYIDANGATQTASSALYTLDIKSDPARIVPKPSQSWPTLGDYPNAVTVTFAAGYGAAGTNVPASLRSWILLASTWLYENRMIPSAGRVPQGFADGLLDREMSWAR